MRTTLSNGYLGSRIDEERSEMRYVMRLADFVKHQNFERILRSRVTWSMPL
jgi:trehalose/maltose hydrolase-like predicted phosphorylase